MELRDILRLLIEHDIAFEKKRKQIETTGIVLDDVFPPIDKAMMKIIGARDSEAKAEALGWFVLDHANGDENEFTMDEMLDYLLDGTDPDAPGIIVTRGRDQ